MLIKKSCFYNCEKIHSIFTDIIKFFLILFELHLVKCRGFLPNCLIKKNVKSLSTEVYYLYKTHILLPNDVVIISVGICCLFNENWSGKYFLFLNKFLDEFDFFFYLRCISLFSYFFYSASTCIS